MADMTGRDRRLQAEWQEIQRQFGGRQDIICRPTAFSGAGLPERYEVEYLIRSICGIENVEALGTAGVSNPPVFADRFVLGIDLPEEFPCVDAPPEFRFLTSAVDGSPLPHPWHPNVRWFGRMAGHVCLNRTDTFTSLAWGIGRIEEYLRYERYHALNEPPYPEDQQVAAWVIRQGEPNEWIYF